MNRLMTATALAATLTMAGCATMVNKRHQSVLVVSEPPGADVLLNGESVGTTPVTVRMTRRGPAELELRKAGCATETVPVPRRVSGWVAGNLLWFNPLAAQGMNSVSQWLISAAAWFAAVLTIDAVSGGAYVRPPVVNVTLTQANGQGAAGCDPVRRTRRAGNHEQQRAQTSHASILGEGVVRVTVDPALPGFSRRDDRMRR